MGENGISANLRDRLDDHRGEASSRPGSIALDRAEGYVGDTFTISGVEFPANEAFDVVWRSVDGQWGALRANEIRNPQYRPVQDTILTVSTDDDGRFEGEWEVREDYGGDHTLEVRGEDGEVYAEDSFTVKPHFELDRTVAPMGETFQVTGYGLGPDRSVSNHQVAWDDGYVGFITGVENHGTAHADIRAVGPPGEHVIQVWRSNEGMPYLQNNTTSVLGPVADGRQSAWTVEVTEMEERPPTAHMGPLLEEEPLAAHLLEPEEDTAAAIDISPTYGQSGTEAVVTGREFPPETEVDLVWHTHAGHRFMDDAVRPTPRPDVLPSVVTDVDGRFQVDVTVPTDIGETRPITAEVDGTSVATTGFVLQPEIGGIEPEAAPVGTEINVELLGIGWALYDNNWVVLYDNKPAGYICSHNRDDDEEPVDGATVRFELRASGEPGLHFIDVVPTFNDNEIGDFDLSNRAHLSHVNNHPLRPEPAFHFTFEVTA